MTALTISKSLFHGFFCISQDSLETLVSPFLANLATGYTNKLVAGKPCETAQNVTSHL